MTTLDEGRMRTCRLPLRSALTMLLSASLRTEMRTIFQDLAVVVVLESGWESVCSCWTGTEVFSHLFRPASSATTTSPLLSLETDARASLRM